MAYDAGTVRTTLEARVDPKGFVEYDQRLARADRQRVEAMLRANVDKGSFARAEASIKRLGGRQDVTFVPRLDTGRLAAIRTRLAAFRREFRELPMRIALEYPSIVRARQRLRADFGKALSQEIKVALNTRTKRAVKDRLRANFIEPITQTIKVDTDRNEIRSVVRDAQQTVRNANQRRNEPARQPTVAERSVTTILGARFDETGFRAFERENVSAARSADNTRRALRAIGQDSDIANLAIRQFGGSVRHSAGDLDQIAGSGRQAASAIRATEEAGKRAIAQAQRDSAQVARIRQDAARQSFLPTDDRRRDVSAVAAPALGTRLATGPYRAVAGEIGKIEHAARRATSEAQKLDRARPTGLRGALNAIPGSAFGVVRAIGRVDGSVIKFNRNLLFMRNVMRLLRWPALIAGAGLAAQAISNLAAGAVGLVGSLGPLGGLLAAIPGGLTLIGQAAGTAFLGLNNVGQALKNTLLQQKNAANDALGSANRQRSSLQSISDAERSVGDAQRQVRTSQEDLNDARKQAVRDLQDLKTAAVDAALAERGATLSLQDALVNLDTVRRQRAAGQATTLDVQRANLEVETARRARAAARQERQRADADARTTRRPGAVERQPNVVSARRQLADAERGVADQLRQVHRAQQDAAASAQAESASTRNLDYAMSQLSASGREFVRFLIGLRPRFKELQAAAQGGFLPGLERGIQAAMRNFGPLLGVVRLTARALGGASERLGGFFGSRGFGRDLSKVGGTNVRVIERLGRVATNLASAFTNLAVAAGPFIEWLSKVTLRFSRWLDTSTKGAENQRKLGRYFDGTRAVLERLGSILFHVGDAFIRIAGIGKRFLGDFLLRELDKSAKALDNWTKTLSGKNSLRDYFQNARKPIVELGKLLGAIFLGFVKIGQAPGIDKVYKQLRTQLLPALEEVTNNAAKGLAPALVQLLTTFVKIIAELSTETGPLTLFIKALNALAVGVEALISVDIGGLKPFKILLEGFLLTLLAYRTVDFATSISGIQGLVKNLLKLKEAQTAVAAGDATFGQKLAAKLAGPIEAVRGRIGRGLRGIAGVIKNFFTTGGGGGAAGGAATGIGQDVGQSIEQGITSKRGRIRDALRRLFGRTAVSTVANTGETIGADVGSGVAAGLATKEGRIRGILRRIFRRGATDAAESGGGNFVSTFLATIAASLGASRVGRMFTRFGLTWGRAAGLGLRFGIVAAVALAAYEAAKILDKVLPKQKPILKEPKGPVKRTIANERDDPSQSFATRLGLEFQGIAQKVGQKIRRAAGVDDAPRRGDRPAGPTGGLPDPGIARIHVPGRGRDGRLKQDARKGAKRDKKSVDDEYRKAFREGRATTITYDLSQGINIARTERTFNRLQRIVRTELEQTKRLIARRAPDIFEPLTKLSPFGNDKDPLNLGSGVRRSIDNARRAARAIAEAVRTALSHMSSDASSEGRDVGVAVEHSLTRQRPRIARAAESIRDDVVQAFRSMNQRSNANAAGLVGNLRETFARLPSVTGRPIARMLDQVADALDALGASGANRLKSAANAARSSGAGAQGATPAARKQAQLTRQRGGVIRGVGMADTEERDARDGDFFATRHQQRYIDTAVMGAAQMGMAGYQRGGRFQQGGTYKVLAAPGEVHYEREHQVPKIDRAMRAVHGFGLNELAHRVSTPHMASTSRGFQRGGIADGMLQMFRAGGKAKQATARASRTRAPSGHLTFKQIVAINRAVGFKNPEFWAHVAWDGETGGDSGAVNPTSGAAGLYQILPSAHPQYNVDRLTHDPVYNARAAFAVSGHGTNVGPWEASRNEGAHGGWGRFLPEGGPGGGGRPSGNAPNLTTADGGAQRVTDFRVTGRRGAVRDMAQRVIDRVQGASNRRLQRAQDEGGPGVGDLSPGGPRGTSSFDGSSVANWIIPILRWARKHGWTGSVSEGWRSFKTQQGYNRAGIYSAPAGHSNHEDGQQYPRGAVDVSQPSQLISVLRGYKGKRRLIGGVLGPIDPWHFSATGHQRGGFAGRFQRGGKPKNAARGTDRFGTRTARRAYRFMQRAWPLVRGRFHAGAMPKPSFIGDPDLLRATQGRAGAMVTGDAAGRRQVVFGANAARHIAAPDPTGLGILLHEWAHVFQRPSPSSRNREGGAQAFADFVRVKVAPKLGLSTKTDYLPYMTEEAGVVRDKGLKYVKSGQFFKKGAPFFRPKGAPGYETNAPGTFQRGGFAGLLPSFQAGGFAGRRGGATFRAKPSDQPTAGQGKPSAKRSRPGNKKPGKHHAPRHPAARFSTGYFDAPFARFTALTADDGPINQAVEVYNIDTDDASQVQEEYFDDAGNIQWDQVNKRISEIRFLQGDIDKITGEIQRAVDLGDSMLAQVEGALKALRARRQAILERAHYVVRRIKSLAASIKDETGKGGKKNKSLISRWTKDIDSYRNELDRLVGTRKVGDAPSTWSGGQLGGTQSQIETLINEGGIRDSIRTELQNLVGVSGNRDRPGGLMHQYRNEWTTLENERVHDLGDKLKPQGGGAAGGVTGAQDIANFLTAINSLRNQYESNFRPLRNYQGGGRVDAPIGQPVDATVHGGELVYDPRSGKLQVIVKNPEESKQAKQIVLAQYNGPVYQQEPESLHAQSVAMAWDLKYRT